MRGFLRGALLRSVAAIVCLMAVRPPAGGTGKTPETSHLTEKVEVRLVLLDVVVVDGAGRPAPGLTKDDFLLTVEGGIVPVETFDVECGEASPAEPRRIVFAIDYAHLGPDWRPPTLAAVRKMVMDSPDPDDRFMIVALTGSLRVEQSFTTDRAEVLRTLDRMERDVTLWADDFRHVSDEPFLDALIALFTVLDAEPGSKAVIHLSNLDVLKGDIDSRLLKLSALAGAARATLHTISARGLDVSKGSPGAALPGKHSLSMPAARTTFAALNVSNLPYASSGRAAGANPCPG